MITKELMGERLRTTRNRAGMTLKDVEASSGLSSTHISEIERGMTSPTIGALIRIAHALKKDPSYFIEERTLEEICVTTEEDRPPLEPNLGLKIQDGTVEALTRGVVCGRIAAFEFRLGAEGRAEIRPPHDAYDLCIFCLEGKLALEIGEFRDEMAPGDSFHGTPAEPPILRAVEPEARAIVIVDPRDGSR